MTNESSYLTAEQELHLVEAHRTLSRLARTCRVPAVLAAVESALAELRIALDGQAMELDYYREPDRALAA